MLKQVYRIIILIIIFIASLYYFGKDIKEVVFSIDNTTSMEEATFPLVTLRTEGEIINLLHGYSSNLDANSIREALTPIGAGQSYEVIINQNEYDIKKLNYELRNFTHNELIEKGSVSVFDVDGDIKTAKINISTELMKDKEYAVKITLITSESRKIYYYHRLRKYDNTYLTDKLDFVMGFHESIKDKVKAEEYIRYLEPDGKKDNTSLANINIHSSFDLITWGNLNPEFITEVIPTVVENYTDIASVALEYIVRANVSGIPELYKVKEYYRIRYSSDRIFLLNYERRMEALFDIELASVSKSQLKLGITNDPSTAYLSSPDKKKFAFVRSRELWFYNLEDNEIVRVFSFRQEDTDYIRDIYDQHDIKILNMDAEGNIDFMVYGYMNRGQYEGRVALVMYEYIRSDGRIEEKVYIPLDEPYQTLKENIGAFAYVNSLDVFYFHIYNSIYAYDLITRQIAELADNTRKDDLVAFYDEGYVAWQESSNPRDASNIKIMDIETGDIQMISADRGYKILLLDKIDSNLIYGYVKEDDITTLIDGTPMTPMSRIEIATTGRDVLKPYYKEGYLITGIEVENNTIELFRVREEIIDGRKTFIPLSNDYIMNQSIEKTPYLNATTRVTENSLTEYYLELPSGFVMEELPNKLFTVNTVISEDPTLRLPKNKNYFIEDGTVLAGHNQYYTYILGELEGSYDEASDAITLADAGVGVVVSNLNSLVWERGVKANRNVINRFEEIELSSTQNTIDSCIKLLANYLGKSIDNISFDLRNISVYEILVRNLDVQPIRLTGATLDQALYYVSKGRPIIAMTGYNDAVLIYGYDAYNVFMIDPKQGKTIKLGIQDSTQLFEEAGNVFLSYLSQ
ncbi:MAG: hypothetical protein EWM47_10105 [Anaerolineaceae bacterium]|nr:MAG: hypothetical protein EWM47_10105 [Anaerolineaceae bacterium]